MQNETIIEVKNLTIKFSENVILKDIDFKVFEGEIFAIIGGSGSGKTLLLKHLVGLNKPSSGEIYISKTNLADLLEKSRTSYLSAIGVAFQYGALLGSMTLEENITLPILEYVDIAPEIAQLIAKTKLALVDLAGYEHYYPNEISGGMKKRASIARALALNPSILFLDEPTSGLDPVTSAEIDELINKLNKTLNTTIIIITHDLETIFNIADRIIMLDKSEKTIIIQGSPLKILKTTNNKKVLEFFKRKINKEWNTQKS